MKEQLLQTKFHIPQIRPNTIPRPRLIKALNRGLSGKVTLVSAPAGFGKSTLIASWLTDPQNVDLPSPVWLSLDSDDNDLARFLAYLTAALQQVAPTIADISQSPPLPTVKTLVVPLINSLVSAPPTLLVLDDYHLIENPSIHELLAELVRRQPPNFHIVLSGRGDAAWLPLAQLRASGQITEIRTKALRFTTAEATAFLAGQDLSAADVATLETRTEGWAAGLQMAALALPGRGDKEQFFQTFTGDDRYLGDYLAEEVLSHLVPEIQQFLEQTAVLDQLCGPLCDVVTGGAGGQQMLAQLEQDGLFVIPLDNKRHWYRYHHLFAEFLCGRLQRRQPDLVPTLHRRASQWFAGQDMPHAAVRHALAMDAPEEALDLIDRYDRILYQRGQIGTLIEWLRPFPKEMLYKRPKLALSLAWAWIIQGNTRTAAAFITALEPHMTAEHIGEFLALRTGLARQQGNFQAAQNWSEKAMDGLDKTDALYDIVNIYQCDLLIGNGQSALARERLTDTLHRLRSQDRHYLETQTLYRLINLHTIQGELHQAAAFCQEAFATMERHKLPFVVGGFHHCLAEIYWEWDQLETAVRYLEEGIEVGKRGGHIPMVAANSLLLAQIRQVNGRDAAVQKLLDEVSQFAINSPQAANWLAKWRAWAALRQGQIEPAESWVAENGVTAAGSPQFHTLSSYLLLLRLFLVRGEWRQGRRLLEQMLQAAEQIGACGIRIQLLLYLAELHLIQGRLAVATKTVERALALGEPGGYIRRFLDDGRPLLGIFVQLRDRYLEGAASYSRSYLEQILAGFGDAAVADAPRPAVLAEQIRLSETISRRELEILQLMGRGLSNPQIAKRLHISVDTVRWHVKNIYNKLEVNNRVQATVRAQSIGLLH